MTEAFHVNALFVGANVRDAVERYDLELCTYSDGSAA